MSFGNVQAKKFYLNPHQMLLSIGENFPLGQKTLKQGIMKIKLLWYLQYTAIYQCIKYNNLSAIISNYKCPYMPILPNEVTTSTSICPYMFNLPSWVIISVPICTEMSNVLHLFQFVPRCQIFQ